MTTNSTVDTTTLPAAMFDSVAFQAQLETAQAIPCCKTVIAAATHYLHEQFRSGAQARDLIRLRAAFVDDLLAILWERQDWGQCELSLVAVGGYGRGELHPHSDVDIMILLGDNCNRAEERLKGFLTLLWDVGFDVGHSVRTIKECIEHAAGDITVLTNLMEARVIRGSEQLMQQVRELTATDKMWTSPDFFRAKLQEQTTRHEKFADTEYNLEPNVKSSPGGLRDLQIIGWIAERHFGVESL
ncbi:MAG: nucleotidyltransferase domain-containing protein, partial [Halioglobus sp.]